MAEWYRLQLKEKIWKGLVERSLDEWNIGTPAYGYLAERIPHPVPFKAAQGRTKSRLILDPARAPVIARIFTWRTVDKLGCPAIAARLNADPAAYPPLNAATGWTAQNVRVILANPKYTGYMVYGRHRTRNGHRTPVPKSSGYGPPAPVHPAIVDRDTCDLAQTVAAGHGTSRDGDDLNPHPATARPDRDRAERQDPRTRRPPRQPRRSRRARLPRPHPRPVRRTPRRTRTAGSPAQDPGQDHPGRRRHQPAGPAPAGRGHPASPHAQAQGPAVPDLRHYRPVEQARPAGHRHRRDHRGHPASPYRHPRPDPGRIPRQQR